MNQRPTLLLTVALAIAAAPVAAAEPTRLLCALTRALSCDPTSDCSVRDIGELNLPRFVDVDLAGKRISGQRPDGSDATTVIDRMARTSETLALHWAARRDARGASWSVTTATPPSRPATPTARPWSSRPAPCAEGRAIRASPRHRAC